MLESVPYLRAATPTLATKWAFGEARVPSPIAERKRSNAWGSRRRRHLPPVTAGGKPPVSTDRAEASPTAERATRLLGRAPIRSGGLGWPDSPLKASHYEEQ
jgi:hypothetical protein